MKACPVKNGKMTLTLQKRNYISETVFMPETFFLKVDTPQKRRAKKEKTSKIHTIRKKRKSAGEEASSLTPFAML